MQLIDRKTNAIINNAEFWNRESVLRSLPRFLIIELTQGCNLSCPMCRTERLGYHGRTMANPLFEMLRETVFGTAEVIDLRGWGESALLPQFEKHAESAFASGAVVRLVTNLSYHKPTVIGLLLRKNGWLDLSIDTLDYESLKIVRPGATLEYIRKNLKYIASMRSTSSVQHLRALITIQRPCIPTLPSTVQELLDSGIDDIVLTPVRIGLSSPVSIAEETSKVLELINQISIITKRYNARLKIAGVVTPDEKIVRPAPCIHPWTHAYFRFDGAVGYCDHLIGPQFENEIFGRLSETGFEAIWNGIEWQRLRTNHSKQTTSGTCFGRCHKCYRNRPVDYEGDILNVGQSICDQAT